MHFNLYLSVAILARKQYAPIRFRYKRHINIESIIALFARPHIKIAWDFDSFDSHII